MNTKMAEKKTGIADWLRDKADRTPDKTAVVDPHGSLTFRRLAEQAESVSSYLQDFIFPCESKKYFEEYPNGEPAFIKTQMKFRKQTQSLIHNQADAKKIECLQPVAIFMEKSCHAVATLIGVILSGNYYCVLDTTLPAARLLQMTGALKSSDLTPCKIVLTDVENLKKAQTVFVGTDVRVIETESDILFREKYAYEKFSYEKFSYENKKSTWSSRVDTDSNTKYCSNKNDGAKDRNSDKKEVTKQAAESVHFDINAPRMIFSHTPLYCSFTSGSTGSPKGVLISHQNVMDFIPVFDESLGITGDDVLACQAPFDFDISLKDIYSCLYKGATLVLVPRAYFVNPTKLMDYLEEHRVTTLIWAVSALLFLSVMQAPSYKKLPLIRQIIYSGEVMPMQHLRYLREAFLRARFVNVYGPTEITCNCTYHILDEADFEKEEVPIGRAFNGRRVFLLNETDEVIAPPPVKDPKIERVCNQTDEDCRIRNTNTNTVKNINIKEAFTKNLSEKNTSNTEITEMKNRIGEICVAGDGLALGYIDDGLPDTNKSWQSIAEIDLNARTATRSHSEESLDADKDIDLSRDMNNRFGKDENCRSEKRLFSEREYLGDKSAEHVGGFQFFLTPDGYIERIYRTGDLATYDDNGELLYRGRLDLQVKMHGHRIELLEVEHHANLISGVDRSCCIFNEEKERLILFFEGSVAEKGIREHLLQELPAHMVPKKIIRVDALPVNPHGKVDRERLKKSETGADV